MGTLSPEEEAKIKKDIREEFDKIDTDKSGMIDKNEFKSLVDKVANKIGENPPKEKDIETAFNEFDTDNSGEISFEEVNQNWLAFSLLVKLSGS